MTRKYSLGMESDPIECNGYVPELPSILVTGVCAAELMTRPTKAIQIYWPVLVADRSPTSEIREIDVQLRVLLRIRISCAVAEGRTVGWCAETSTAKLAGAKYSAKLGYSNP